MPALTPAPPPKTADSECLGPPWTQAYGDHYISECNCLFNTTIPENWEALSDIEFPRPDRNRGGPRRKRPANSMSGRAQLNPFEHPELNTRGNPTRNAMRAKFYETTNAELAKWKRTGPVGRARRGINIAGQSDDDDDD